MMAAFNVMDFCNLFEAYAYCFSITRMQIFNPLLASAHKSARIAKISILKLEGIIKKY